MTEPKDIPDEEPKPQPWDIARGVARAEVAKRGLTAAQVRGLPYADMAALYGLPLKPRPEWFFYQEERDRLAGEMEDAAETAKISALRLAVQAAVNSKLNLGQSLELTNAEIAALVRRLK